MNESYVFQIVISFVGLLLSVIGAIIAWMASRIVVSVQELNIRVAQIIERVEAHDRRISKLEDLN